MPYSDNQKAFIEKAMKQVSDNPIDRLSLLTKNIFQRNSYVFDAHDHFFDGRCINALYLGIRLLISVPESLKAWAWRLITGKPMLADKLDLSVEALVEDLYEHPEQVIAHNNPDNFLDQMEKELSELEKELEISPFTEMEKEFKAVSLGKWWDIIRLLASNKMSSVFETFERKYAIHNVLKAMGDGNPELITVALGMDLNSGWQNSISKTYSKQNDELGKLAHSHPALPFLPVDPRRSELKGEENLYTAFLKAFDKTNPSFFGVKCYPSLGYHPFDQRLQPIFEICEAKKIPVLTHCGGTIVSTFKNPIIVNNDGVDETVPGNKRIERAKYLNEPQRWSGVLNRFKGLKLCFGHFGSSEAWLGNLDYAHRVTDIIKLMRDFEVYADFSFNLESNDATKIFAERILATGDEANLLQKRTMFGTDFWVILPMTDLQQAQRKFIQTLSPIKQKLLKDNVKAYLGLEAL
jgi:predicted TIM-barrel fold metal-dependent hydrolase